MNTFRCLANNKKGTQCNKPSVKALDTGEPVCERHWQLRARPDLVPPDRRYIAYDGLRKQLELVAEHNRTLHNESLSFISMHGGVELRVHLHIDHINGTLAITPWQFMVRRNEDPMERYDRRHSPGGDHFGFINGKDPEKWKRIAGLITEASEHGHTRLLEVKAAKLRTKLTIHTAEFLKA